MAERQGKIFVFLIQALQEQRFLSRVRTFVAENLAAFQDAGEEHKLEWTCLHSQYKALFEAQAAEVLAREGTSTEEVVVLCQCVTGGARDGGPLAQFLEWSTASTNYEAFVAMMRRGTAPYRPPESARAKMLTTLLAALEEPQFQSQLVAFVLARHSAFLEADTQRHELHASYRNLCEGHIREVLARDSFELSDLDGLVQEVRAEGSEDRSANLDSCLQAIFAYRDFDRFERLMRSVREQVEMDPELFTEEPPNMSRFAPPPRA